MIYQDARALGFSDRPLGTMAVRIEPQDTSAEKIRDEVVLRLGDASVHVADIQEQNDGSFNGTVCRFLPDGSAVGCPIAIADGVNFRASHVFTFSGFADAPPARARRPGLQPKKTGEEFRARTVPEIPAPKKAGRHVYKLLGLGVAVLAFGIAVGYTIGRTSEPVALAQRTGPARAGLKIDYELRAGAQQDRTSRRD